MTTTLLARLRARDRYNRETLAYFDRLQFTLPPLDGERSHLLGVELRELPEIIARVREAGYFKEREAEEWDVTNFGADGLTLYLDAYGGKGERGEDLWVQCYVFIPAANVVAVHDVGRTFFDYLSRDAEPPPAETDSVN